MAWKFPDQQPIGVIRYTSHEDMIHDRELWLTEIMVEIARFRGRV